MTGDDVSYWLYSKGDDLWCYIVRTQLLTGIRVRYSVYVTYKLLSSMWRVANLLKKISR